MNLLAETGLGTHRVKFYLETSSDPWESERQRVEWAVHGDGAVCGGEKACL